MFAFRSLQIIRSKQQENKIDVKRRDILSDELLEHFAPLLKLIVRVLRDDSEMRKVRLAI